MYYETVFIVNPDISQENTEVLTNELVEKIEKAGARIVKREYWGSRPLAYSIQKRNRGHYTLLVTDGAASMAKIIDTALLMDERVLRFLTTTITELSDEPSPLLRRRAAPVVEEAKVEAEAEVAVEAAVEEVTAVEEVAAPAAVVEAAESESGESAKA